MYKNVAKRILAVILTFCMVGTMPDTALLASSVDTESMHTEVDEADISIAAEDSEEKDVLEDSEMPDRTETETEMEQEEDDISAPVSKAQDASAPAAVMDAPVAREGEISLESTTISKPETLPNQVDKIIPDSGVVTDKIVGLTITIAETGAELEQGTDYTVTVESKSGSLAKLVITGAGSYTGILRYDVTLGKDIADSTVKVTAIWGEGEDRREDVVDASTPLEYEYEGRRINPKVKVEDSLKPGSDKSLTDADYKVTWPEQGNLNVGTGKILIEGIGNYA